MREFDSYTGICEGTAINEISLHGFAANAIRELRRFLMIKCGITQVMMAGKTL